MASVVRQYGDDTWVLTLEDALVAAAVRDDVTSPYGAFSILEYVSGEAQSGVFIAGPLAAGSRPFKAIVSNALGALQQVVGTLADDGTDIMVNVTTATVIGSVTLSAQLAVTGAAPNVTWFYQTTPDILDSFTEAAGFTVQQAGVFMYGGVATDTSRHVEVRVIESNFSAYPTVGEGTVEVVSLAPADELGTILVSTEPAIHAIIGAPLGDLELDIGKSVPWTSLFANNVFITDINIGDPRYWVIDWDKSFKTAKYTSLTIDFFNDPVAWRQAQFQSAQTAWNYHDDDWVLFVDGHEGMSCDTRSLPDDVGVNPFQAYVQREIQRAVDASDDWACIPFYAFVRNGPPVPQEHDIEDPALVAARIEEAGLDITVEEVNKATVLVGPPYYYLRAPTNEQGLVRLVKVSALRDPEFNWESIDTLSTPSADVKLQVVSYGYAHWVNPDTEVDEGFQMRRYLNMVRPLPGLPITGSDATGTLGPYAYADNGALVVNPGNSTSQPLLTPMYVAMFRDNPRDGVWYQFGVTGSRSLMPIPVLATAVGTGLAATVV